VTPTPQLTARVVLAVAGLSLTYVAWVLAVHFAGGPDATVTHVVRGWCDAWPPLRLLLGGGLVWLALHLCCPGFP
jgi:hypothetical protein